MLGIRITSYTFLSYASHGTTYSIFDIENKIIFKPGDAIFHEKKKSPFKLKISGGKENGLSQPSSSNSLL